MQRNLRELRSTRDFVSPRVAGNLTRKGRLSKRSVEAEISAAAADIEAAAGPSHHFEEHDDREERRKGVQQRQQERRGKIASSSVDESSAAGSVAMSNAEITEHYQACIKLNAQNKITSKNAFQLHLIDYLKKLLDEKEASEGHTNFQMAGASLDVGAKIYSYRVDIVHQATYQMIGNLSKKDNRGEKRPIEQDEDEGGGYDSDGQPIAAGGLENVSPSQQLKKKRRGKPGAASKTVENRLENITITHVESGYEFDPLNTYICQQVEEKRNCGLMSAVVGSLDSKFRLALHSYDIPEKEFSGENVGIPLDQIQADPAHSAILRNLVNTMEQPGTVASTVPAMEWFTFDATDFARFPMGAEDSAPPGGSQNQWEGGDDMAMDEGGGGFSPPGSPGVADNDIDLGGGAGEDDVSTVSGVDAHAIQQQAEQFPPLRFADDEAAGSSSQATLSQSVAPSQFDLIKQALSQRPSDYSHFSPRHMQAFVGPEHWKNKIKQAKEVREKEREKKLKKTRQPKKKLDLSDIIDDNFLRAVEEIMSKLEDRPPDFTNLGKPSRAATTLTQATLRRYGETETTYDPRQKYNEADLDRLFTRSEIRPPTETQDPTNAGLDIDDGIPDYHLGNPAEVADYVPQLSPMHGHEDWTEPAEDPGEDSPGGPFGLPESQGLGDDPFSQPPDSQGDGFAGGLVAAPLQAQKLQIEYAKQAKKVDVKRLKAAMWKILNNAPPNGPSDASTVNQSIAKQSIESSFARVCAELPRHVTPGVLKNLSVPIVLVAFLHMCNEKVLRLEQPRDEQNNPVLKDFRIVQG